MQWDKELHPWGHMAMMVGETQENARQTVREAVTDRQQLLRKANPAQLQTDRAQGGTSLFGRVQREQNASAENETMRQVHFPILTQRDHQPTSDEWFVAEAAQDIDVSINHSKAGEHTHGHSMASQLFDDTDEHPHTIHGKAMCRVVVPEYLCRRGEDAVGLMVKGGEVARAKDSSLRWTAHAAKAVARRCDKTGQFIASIGIEWFLDSQDADGSLIDAAGNGVTRILQGSPMAKISIDKLGEEIRLHWQHPGLDVGTNSYLQTWGATVAARNRGDLRKQCKVGANRAEGEAQMTRFEWAIRDDVVPKRMCEILTMVSHYVLNMPWYYRRNLLGSPSWIQLMDDIYQSKDPEYRNVRIAVQRLCTCRWLQRNFRQ